MTKSPKCECGKKKAVRHKTKSKFEENFIEFSQVVWQVNLKLRF